MAPSWLFRRAHIVQGEVVIRGFALVFCLMSVPALAQDFDALMDEGVALRARAEDHEALDRFERAAALRRTPVVVAQIGLAEQALGRFVAAEAHLTEALELGGAWIERQQAVLEAALVSIRAQLGTLEVLCEAEDAELVVEGRRVALPSGPLRVLAGEVEYRVEAPGHEPSRRSARVASDAVVRVTVHLLPTAPPEVDATVGTGPSTVSSTGANDPTSSSTSTARSNGLAVPILGATAGAALVGGVVADVLRVRAVQRWNGDACAPEEATLRSENCADDRDRWRRARVATVASFGVAAVLGVVTLVLALRGDEDDDSSALACDVAGLGLTCGGRF
ncbi:MAG: hypothetical protein H6722_25915 [Sandaracinus sp.]|nr:hypothetical protein [Sandaracinus sp.]MCB9624377.1 hypothetical protein [Sandaracinus sp.]